MKVALITYHDAHNYGAVLQAYALKTIIQQLGYSCDIINFQNEYINSIIGDVLLNSNINLDNSYAVIRAKEQIFQEIKKYLTSTENLGLFNKSAKDVRKDLYFDRPGHKSLSSYTGRLFTKESTEHSKGVEMVKKNLFLNTLKYKVGENDKPSLITFNNQESFEVDQEELYASVKELIANDYSLPDRNGEPYSTRKLIQELTAYSYVGGGVVQKAVEFHKFLPIEYSIKFCGKIIKLYWCLKICGKTISTPAITTVIRRD